MVENNWKTVGLKLAGIYNLIWGAWVLIFPNSFFSLLQIESPNYPQIWQSVGMIVGVYGIGYWIASYNYIKHWPIILVGFLGKFLGPIGAIWNIYQSLLPLEFIWLNVFNDFIWLPLFTIVLWEAYIAERK